MRALRAYASDAWPYFSTRASMVVVRMPSLARSMAWRVSEVQPPMVTTGAVRVPMETLPKARTSASFSWMSTSVVSSSRTAYSTERPVAGREPLEKVLMTGRRFLMISTREPIHAAFRTASSVVAPS